MNSLNFIILWSQSNKSVEEASSQRLRFLKPIPWTIKTECSEGDASIWYAEPLLNLKSTLIFPVIPEGTIEIFSHWRISSISLNFIIW